MKDVFEYASGMLINARVLSEALMIHYRETMSTVTGKSEEQITDELASLEKKIRARIHEEMKDRQGPS